MISRKITIKKEKFTKRLDKIGISFDPFSQDRLFAGVVVYQQILFADKGIYRYVLSMFYFVCLWKMTFHTKWVNTGQHL